MALLETRQTDGAIRRPDGRRRRRLRGRRAADLLDHRPQRRRQDDRLQRHHRHLRADRRLDRVRRPAAAAAVRPGACWRCAPLIGTGHRPGAALVSVDVNALWRATIKRNYAGPGRAVFLSAAWRDAWNYLQGTLALDRMRGDRWAVRTADGRRTLGYAKSLDEAEQMRDRVRTS